jgi:hypothetical protein
MGHEALEGEGSVPSFRRKPGGKRMNTKDILCYRPGDKVKSTLVDPDEWLRILGYGRDNSKHNWNLICSQKEQLKVIPLYSITTHKRK